MVGVLDRVAPLNGEPIKSVSSRNATDDMKKLVVCDFHPNDSNFVRDRHRAQIEVSGFRF